VREHDGLELPAGFGEQPLVLGVRERREEILRPIAPFPGERFTARLQNELVAALPARPGCPVYIYKQIIWNVKSSRWHE
jgi:hypothetical protein